MSRAQEPHRPFLPFGNPLRLLSPKGPRLSPKLLSLLDNFEERLGMRIRKLMPPRREDVLQLSWMRFAMMTLCDVHSDVINLIMDLELPVSDWDDKWIEVYLDNSVKLLDICNAFTSEISCLKQGHLFLRCASHNMDGDPSKQFRACSYLDSWKHQISQKNPRLDNCFTILDDLVQMIELPKVKNSTKGKALMRALYGVKVFTISVCSVVAAAFSGSAKKLVDLQVSGTYPWAEHFIELQSFLNEEIRKPYTGGCDTLIKEVEAVDKTIKKAYPILKGETNPANGETLLRGLASELSKSSENLSQELHLLVEEVDRFFRVVLSGRDNLLSNPRDDDRFPEKDGAAVYKIVVSPIVRLKSL